jgi:DNA-binding NarL/FixJ family response regulator
VLIVDDQPVIRHAVRAYLEHDARFVLVGEAATARQAIDFAATQPLDAILLDQNMPQATGLQVLPMLRELQPRARIVMLTYGSDLEDEARMLGADAVVIKDLPLQDVVVQLLPGWPVIDLVERDLAGVPERAAASEHLSA